MDADFYSDDMAAWSRDTAITWHPWLQLYRWAFHHVTSKFLDVLKTETDYFEWDKNPFSQR